jgi:hypothetical protein
METKGSDVALPKALKGVGDGAARARKSGGTGQLERNVDCLGRVPVDLMMS